MQTGPFLELPPSDSLGTVDPPLIFLGEPSPAHTITLARLAAICFELLDAALGKTAIEAVSRQ